MKRFLALVLMAFLGTQIMAEELNINGTVVDESGNAVPDHAVYLSSTDSVGSFYYYNTVYTNEAGFFSDVVQLEEGITQGEILATTESCNEMIAATAFFNPSSYEVNFAFEICTDTTGGGGNDSIVEGCENYFYYTFEEGLQVFFFGEVNQEGDVSYNWNFGDGTSDDGMETQHTYAEEGNYEVSLHTILNDTCEFTSYQTVYVINDSTGGGNDSTNCINDFSFTIDNYTINLEGWVGDNNVVSAYWDFGDGNSAEGISVEHTYNEAGIYNVTFTTEYANGDSSCVAISTKSIFIDEYPTGDYLYGTVIKGDALLDYGIVQLFRIVNDTVGGDDDIILYNETSLDSAGMYFFLNIPSGNYLILAQATEQSIYFNETVPTYYGDVIHWADASIVSLGEPMNPYDIHLYEATEPNSGDAEINVNVVGEGFKSQLIEENIIVLLLDENNNALSFTLTELNSDFNFSELAYGTYIVYAEVVGINTQAGMVTLSADNSSAIVNIVVTPNGTTTGLNDLNKVQISGNIYPNPVGSSARMDLNIIEASEVQMVLLNQMGQILQSISEQMPKGINKIELNTTSYPSGVYFIQISNEKTTITQKFIKK